MLPSRGASAPPLLFVPKQGRRVIWGHAPSRAGVRFLWGAPYLLFVPKQGYTLWGHAIGCGGKVLW